MKTFNYILVILALGLIVFFTVRTKTANDKVTLPVQDVANMTYRVSRESFTLKDGKAVKEFAPGSATLNTLTLFGEPVYGDLDADGDTDVALWLENNPGGTGIFYYAVLVMNNNGVYQPTDTMLLGDRIAPQSLNMQDGRAVYNFVERKVNEPMTTPPSVGKSVWVNYDKATGDIGEWVKDFEGEANPAQMTLGMKSWQWVSTTYSNDTKIVPKDAKKFVLTFKNDGTFSASTDCNGIGGNYVAKDKQITFSQMMSTLMYCDGSQENDFRKVFEETQSYFFTSKGELVFNLKFDSGSVIFR